MIGDLVLLGFVLVVAIFALGCWLRLLHILRVDAQERACIDKWLAERRQYGEESSLADDVNSGLPEEFHAPNESNPSGRAA